MKSLSETELLHVLRYGIYTKLKGLDTEISHYAVIDFNDDTDELLICYCDLHELWRGDNDLSYRPHILKGKDKNKTWFVEEPTGE